MVSGAEKRRRRREAAAAVAASQDSAEKSDSSEGETEPVQVVTYEEGPPAALPSSIDAFRLRAKHLNSSVKIITDFYSGDVSEDWDIAKSRLGATQAGESLERFVCLNTKIIPLDPWENCEEGKPVFATGSADPLTIDVIAVVSNLAATTKDAVLADPMYGFFVKTKDRAAIHKRGMWYVMAGPPTPGEGLQLQPWEKVFGLTARYAAPFSRGNVSNNPLTMMAV